MCSRIITVLRHAAWIIPAILAFMILSPGMPELRTLLIITIVECMSLALSGLSAFVYTNLDFTKMYFANALGFIFLGVHICIGLTILGVYLAQF